MDTSASIRYLQFAVRVSILENSFDMVIATIDQLKGKKWSVTSFLELYRCLQYDQYSFADLRKISSALILESPTLVRLYCILNPKIGPALILEAILRDLRRFHRAHASLRTCQFTYPVAQVLSSFLLSVDADIIINGHTFAHGLYDSLSLTTGFLAALHVPDEVLELFVVQTHCLDLFDLATRILMRTQNAPAQLIADYRAHQFVHPIAIRVYSPTIHDDDVISDTPAPPIESEFKAYVEELNREEHWHPAKKIKSEVACTQL